ncbi:MAG: endonuclease/exonuclease/phosphatase family protein [Bdellovibrionales bacterium]|nr:endonuclease/exonuclease/phosphatase family protein [Bdellovibrionales bacterium]
MSLSSKSRLRILTYNIHKGFTAFNRKFVLEQIKKSIEQTQADLVCLQEVVGSHSKNAKEIKDWPKSSQFEFLADKVWPHFSYGKNSVYTEGDHGNAVLSKYPILFTENQDVSSNKVERRGLLHVTIDFPKSNHPLHAFSVHLGLFQRDRTKQIVKLAERISKMIPNEAPVIIAGDFNDWRQDASSHIKKDLRMDEAFMHTSGKHAYTYPSNFPLLALDRIYYRNLHCVRADPLEGNTWNTLSDHLPLVAEFEAGAESRK